MVVLQVALGVVGRREVTIVVGKSLAVSTLFLLTRLEIKRLIIVVVGGIYFLGIFVVASMFAIFG